jgi:hypothetical protein
MSVVGVLVGSAAWSNGARPAAGVDDRCRWSAR